MTGHTKAKISIVIKVGFDNKYTQTEGLEMASIEKYRKSVYQESAI